MERDILKKSLEHFQPADVTLIYRFITSEATAYPAVILCRLLGVSRNGPVFSQDRRLADRRFNGGRTGH
jgi:hypothetical protein